MSSDVSKTIHFLTVLGFEVTFRDNPDDTTYAGVSRDSVEVHIQWNDLSNLPTGTDRPTLRFLVDDVDELANELTNSEMHGIEPFTTAWGTYEFHLQDHDHNGYQFYK
ncbi:VOC family protein [Rhodohalobacter sulfatireducens]|uniref:Glyoxalase/fosfomycin resistance/dioxygenase domain-containing protein n=1 Tax=Rhodohalobacter sulfatireducens TaxID=2911366 RepID=A0ABS9KDK9_9BACT|nr:VOC family protein [Rhodohalobacter sulfatireducens]MCG2588949.1 hypothetical protein [Rhodohalobacter sulfatireducens]